MVYFRHNQGSLGIAIMVVGPLLVCCRSGFMLRAPVHVQTVPGFELLSTQFAADHLAYVRLYVIPHVLPYCA